MKQGTSLVSALIVSLQPKVEKAGDPHEVVHERTASAVVVRETSGSI